MNPQVRTAVRQFSLALLLLLFLVLVWVVVEFIVFRGETPVITDETGLPVPGSIARLEEIALGGVSQTILIRGRDSANPLVLFLHGGPGMPSMFLAHAFQYNLEADFVFVHWDRRGAGKSYSAGAESESLTVRQCLEDLFELTLLLRERFHQERIYLAGHSWGSYLGVLAAQEHPEYYAAYIGMGQLIADTVRTRIVQRRYLYNIARAVGDTSLTSRLIRWDGTIREEDLFRYRGEIRAARSPWPLILTGLWAPEYDLFDALNVARGSSEVARRMEYDVPTGPFEESAREFEIPVFFLLGRYDYATPSVLAEDYFLRLRAPLKDLIWFDRSAHFPFWEEPAAFENAMRAIRTQVDQFWLSHRHPDS